VQCCRSVNLKIKDKRKSNQKKGEGIARAIKKIVKKVVPIGLLLSFFVSNPISGKRCSRAEEKLPSYNAKTEVAP
jgi:hypothetical protein